MSEIREFVVKEMTELVIEKIDENKKFKFKNIKDKETLEGLSDIVKDATDIIKAADKDYEIETEEIIEICANVVLEYVDLGKIGKIPFIGSYIKNKIRKGIVYICNIIIGFLAKKGLELA